MDHWLTDVCKPRLKPRTWGTYASVIANNIVPSIGAVRLDELKPAHFRRMERYVMDEQGKSSGTAGSAWRTLHKALEDAVLEGVIERNPAVKGTAPRVALKERAPPLRPTRPPTSSPRRPTTPGGSCGCWPS